MTNVCVITGGGSGMGLEVAKLVGKHSKVILVGRTVKKLESAIEELCGLGIDAEAFPCDTGDRESIKKLVAHAKEQGKLKTVIHAAGLSPRMADGKKIFAVNAIGTINVDEEFGEAMDDGCILNVASMAGHMIPADNVPAQLYKLALSNVDAFAEALSQMLTQVPEDQQSNMAYSVSKNFVIWYTARMAVRYGHKGLRVVSISPGTFSTPMGKLEGDQASAIACNGALGRVGDPAEIARMMAFMVSDECSYLTGVDILYDGGAVAAVNAAND